MTEEKKFPETRTTGDSLMNHVDGSDLNLRILNMITGTSLMSVVLEESYDSFLVALPSRLMALEAQRMVEPHMPVKLARIMKSAVITVIPCYGEFEFFYIEYLLNTGKKEFPELFTESFESKLKGRFGKIKDIMSKKESKPAPPAKEEPAAGDSIVMQPSPTKYRH